MKINTLQICLLYITPWIEPPVLRRKGRITPDSSCDGAHGGVKIICNITLQYILPHRSCELFFNNFDYYLNSYNILKLYTKLIYTKYISMVFCKKSKNEFLVSKFSEKIGA